MKEIGKKYCFVDSYNNDITICEIMSIKYSDPITYTFKNSRGKSSYFQRGSVIDNNSFEIDNETTIENVKDKYPELFL